MCAVIKPDCSHISFVFHYPLSVSYMCFAVRYWMYSTGVAAHYRLVHLCARSTQVDQWFCLLLFHGVVLLFRVDKAMLTDHIGCPHADRSQVTCTCTCVSVSVCEHLPLHNQLVHSYRGTAERLAIFWKWKRRLTSFAQALTHPRTADTSPHTEAGKQSATETHSLGSCGGEDELL